MGIEIDDWRLFDQEKYLKDKALKKVKFIKKNEDQDHTHCVFCWAKFSEYDGDLHIGYSTLDNMHWICEKCFEDFKDMFHWVVVKGDIS